MKETLRDLRRLAEEQNVNDYLHQRWAFHAICYRASGRQRLVDEVGRLFWRADRYNRLVLSTPSGSASRSAATGSSSPRARRRTATAPSAWCTRACAGRSSGRRASLPSEADAA